MRGASYLAARMWRQVDKDGSGHLDNAEIWRVMWQMNPELEEKELHSISQQMALEMDTDGDGCVSEAEFLRWWRDQTPEMQQQLAGGAVMAEQDLMTKLGLSELEAKSLFDEAGHSNTSSTELDREQPARKGDVESSMAEIMVMLRGIDARIAESAARICKVEEALAASR